MSEKRADKLPKEDFIEYALDKVYFYIESKFWSKITIKQVKLWMQNFIDLNEQYCAAKLLDRFVYYSEEDIICLLKYGLKEVIFNELQLTHEIESNFNITENELFAKWEQFKAQTALIPMGKGLTDSSKHIARYFCNDIGFPESNVIDSNNIDSNFIKKFKRVLMIDDFLGSGDQLIEFWNYQDITIDGYQKKMFELPAQFEQISFDYFCLVATEEGLERFFSEELDHNKGLKIINCEVLKKKFKIFGQNSVYFTEEEMHDCKQILQKVSERCGTKLLGHNDMDYAIAFHHCIPDTSLPIFYEENAKWHYLIRSKKTRTYDEF